jgi:hypothetical protein
MRHTSRRDGDVQEAILRRREDLMAKKPDYRLQVLFEMREKAVKEAEEFYAEKQKALAAEKKKHDDMKQQLRDMVAAREQKKVEYTEEMREGKLNIAQIQANDRHIEKMKQQEQAFQVDIQRQQERVNEAQGEVDDAMEALLEANTEFKALEKHKEKWAKKVKRERMLKEEDAAEDIAQAQYFARMLERKSEEGE